MLTMIQCALSISHAFLLSLQQHRRKTFLCSILLKNIPFIHDFKCKEYISSISITQPEQFLTASFVEVIRVLTSKLHGVFSFSGLCLSSVVTRPNVACEHPSLVVYQLLGELPSFILAWLDILIHLTLVSACR